MSSSQPNVPDESLSVRLRRGEKVRYRLKAVPWEGTPITLTFEYAIGLNTAVDETGYEVLKLEMPVPRSLLVSEHDAATIGDALARDMGEFIAESIKNWRKKSGHTRSRTRSG